MICLLLFMMIGQSMAGLTCDKYIGVYYPDGMYLPIQDDWDKEDTFCRAPDINAAFNDGSEIMKSCHFDGWVSKLHLFFVWM